MEKKTKNKKIGKWMKTKFQPCHLASSTDNHSVKRGNVAFNLSQPDALCGKVESKVAALTILNINVAGKVGKVATLFSLPRVNVKNL